MSIGPGSLSEGAGTTAGGRPGPGGGAKLNGGRPGGIPAHSTPGGDYRCLHSTFH